MKTISTSSQGRRSSVETITVDIFVVDESGATKTLKCTEQWPVKLWRRLEREAKKLGITVDQLADKILRNALEQKAVAA